MADNPFRPENQAMQMIVKHVFEKVLNKKEKNDLTHEELEFVTRYNIDLKQVIKSAQFSGKITYRDGVVKSNVFQITYYKTAISKESLTPFPTQSTFFSDGIDQHMMFFKIDFKEKMPEAPEHKNTRIQSDHWSPTTPSTGSTTYKILPTEREKGLLKNIKITLNGRNLNEEEKAEHWGSVTVIQPTEEQKKFYAEMLALDKKFNTPSS